MDNWIKKSNQTWKVVLAFFMALISVTLFSVFFIVKPVNDSIYLSVLFSAIGSAFGILVFLILIKCPFCRRSVAYYFIRNSSAQDWLMDFIHIGSCPICKNKF